MIGKSSKEGAYAQGRPEELERRLMNSPDREGRGVRVELPQTGEDYDGSFGRAFGDRFGV